MHYTERIQFVIRLIQFVIAPPFGVGADTGETEGRHAGSTEPILTARPAGRIVAHTDSKG